MWTCSKRFYFYIQDKLSGIINEQSWQCADSSISPCCGNVKNCHFSWVLPDGNWKYGKFAALLHKTSALDYSWYCQFLCISSVQWNINIAKEQTVIHLHRRIQWRILSLISTAFAFRNRRFFYSSCLIKYSDWMMMPHIGKCVGIKIIFIIFSYCSSAG